MLYQITDETIQALRNVIVATEELYDKRPIVDADDVIMLQSVTELNKIIQAWEHDEQLFDQHKPVDI